VATSREVGCFFKLADSRSSNQIVQFNFVRIAFFSKNPSLSVTSIPNRIRELGVTAVGGGVPYLAHHVKRVSGLVETALDVQVCSLFTADDAAKIGEYVRVREISILNPDWASVGGVQCHNFSLLAADVETDFLCKDFKSPGLLLDVRLVVIIALNSQHNLGLPSKRRESI